MWKKLLIGVVAFGLLIVGAVYSVLSSQPWRCEACITYKGASLCRAAHGATAPEAYRSAADAACAMLANGVTERMACPNTPPTKRTCARNK